MEACIRGETGKYRSSVICLYILYGNSGHLPLVRRRMGYLVVSLREKEKIEMNIKNYDINYYQNYIIFTNMVYHGW